RGRDGREPGADGRGLPRRLRDRRRRSSSVRERAEAGAVHLVDARQLRHRRGLRDLGERGAAMMCFVLPLVQGVTMWPGTGETAVPVDAIAIVTYRGSATEIASP